MDNFNLKKYLAENKLDEQYIGQFESRAAENLARAQAKFSNAILALKSDDIRTAEKAENAYLAIAHHLKTHLNSFNHPLYISLPIILFGLGNGFSVANCIIGGVSSTGNQSGTATGVAGALQMSSGGIIGAIVIGLGGDENFLTCLFFMNFLCLTALFSSFFKYKY